MKERTDIIIPDAVVAMNGEKRERIRKTNNFEKTDRAPVFSNCNQWIALAARGVKFRQYINSPRDNLREQILNYKWKVENALCDEPVATEVITIGPDIGCIRGTEFPMEIIWQDDQPPKTRHMLHNPEDVDSLAVPDPDGGLNSVLAEWYKAMADMAGDFDVRLNGEKVAVKATISHPGGPMPGAFALAGAELFLWMAADPDRVHHLMDMVTESHINCIRFFDELTGRGHNHPQPLGADTAERISADMFREFVVPYYNRIWQKYPGKRSLHNCGQNDHLLESMRDDLRIDNFNGFGFPTDRKLLGETFGGRVIMSGGPDPMLLLYGDRERVIAEGISYIKTAGANGGFILQPGGGAAAETSVDNFQWLVEASRRGD